MGYTVQEFINDTQKNIINSNHIPLTIKKL